MPQIMKILELQTELQPLNISYMINVIIHLQNWKKSVQGKTIMLLTPK